MKIIRARLKPYGAPSEFTTISSKIKSLIEKNFDDNFHFVVDDNGVKRVIEFGPDNINEELVGQTLPVREGNYSVTFNEDGTLTITDGLNENVEEINESLPRQKSVDQLKALRKLTKGIDIADRIPDLMKQGANIHYSRNVIDSGIESYEDFEKKNKSFIPSWNLKHLMSPYKNKKNKKVNESKIYGIEILPEEALSQLDDYVDYKDSENKIEVIPDPKVEGTYALRIYRKSDNFEFDLLWNRGGYDEVDFNNFPPTSGDLKFFI